jgi:nitrogen fixation/metabolism regulation signal transduction histidine kinase
MVNLIVNAIQAMSGIGKARANYRSASMPSRSKVACASRCGTPARVEPFYTTKPEGMGMGLSICRSIIEAHGGRLWAISCEPHGALFQVTIPLTGPPSVIDVAYWHKCEVPTASSNVRVRSKTEDICSQRVFRSLT